MSRRWRTVGLYAVEQTREGQRRQARAAGSRRVQRDRAERPVAILSSDFSRTFETAKIVANAVDADVEAEPALRERDFGDFELGPNTAYEAVWEQGAIDAKHTAWGGRRPPPFWSARQQRGGGGAKATRYSSCRTTAS